MAREDGGSAFAKICRAVETVRARHPEYQSGFTLVANGCKRQDVQQVHFHMFTGDAVVNIYPAREPAERAVFQDGTVRVVQHPRPNWETHFVVLPCAPRRKAGKLQSGISGRSCRASTGWTTRSGSCSAGTPSSTAAEPGARKRGFRSSTLSLGEERARECSSRRRGERRFALSPARKSLRRFGPAWPSALYVPAVRPGAEKCRQVGKGLGKEATRPKNGEAEAQMGVENGLADHRKNSEKWRCFRAVWVPRSSARWMFLRPRPQGGENGGQVKMCLGTGAVQPEKRRGRTQTVVENSEKWRFFASFASCTLCIFLQSGVLRGEMRADRKAAGQTENEGRRFLGKRSSEGFAERRETAGPAPLWRKKGPKSEKKS